MAIVIKNPDNGGATVARKATSTPAASDITTCKGQRGHCKALTITLDLHQPGRLRVGHWLSLLSISHASFYIRLRAGQIPPPDGYDGKRPYWKTSTVRQFLEA